MIRTLLLTCALAAPATAQTVQPEHLQGDWLGFAASAILLGMVTPVIEEMSVTGPEIRQFGWTLVSEPEDCTGAPDQPAACAPPVDLGAARHDLQEGRLVIAPEGPQTIPYDHPVDAGLWPEVALAGHVWQFRMQDRMAVMSRETLFEGEPVRLDRIYLRAPAGTAGRLFGYLEATDASIARSVCAVSVLQEDPAAWAGFLDLIERLAPVTAELARLRRSAPRGPEDRRRHLTLYHGPEALGSAAADVSDIPAAARADWLVHLAWLRAGQPVPEGRAVLDPLGWPASPETVARAEACLEYFGAY